MHHTMKIKVNFREVVMQDLISQEGGKLYVTSKQVADHFGKHHRNVLRDIRQIASDCEKEFGALNFEPSEYTSSQNKTFECYNITRDGFAVLAMGFTGKQALQWKIKYMNAFNAMESALKNSVPVMHTLNEIVKRAESDRQIASDCASMLANYKKVKQKHEEDFEKAVESVQMTLGFTKGDENE